MIGCLEILIDRKTDAEMFKLSLAMYLEYLFS